MNKKIKGEVIQGVQVGQKFGLATANLAVDFANIDLVEGVYGVKINFEARIFEGILHYGALKTFERAKTCEVHIFDFNQNIYGKNLEIEILKFLRPTKKFRNSDALFTQIEKDIRDTQKYFCRQKIYTQWEVVTQTQKEIAQKKGLEKISKNQKFQEAKNIFIYAPQKNREIDFTEKLMQKFPQKKYFFPFIETIQKNKNDTSRPFLRFYQVEKFFDLERGAFGILTPKVRAEKEFVSQTSDKKNKSLVFVPSVAVDQEGFRLGRGGGFYDQFLSNDLGKNCYTITVLPNFSILKNIPKNEWDQKIEEVIGVELS